MRESFLDITEEPGLRARVRNHLDAHSSEWYDSSSRRAIRVADRFLSVAAAVLLFTVAVANIHKPTNESAAKSTPTPVPEISAIFQDKARVLSQNPVLPIIRYLTGISSHIPIGR